MKYFIAALFLVNIISLAESGPWGRDKTRGGPMGDENRFNRSRYSGNCSHPWFNSTLGEFNNTFGFVPPLEKFQMFWEFLKNFFNESYGDFNETMDFPFPRKEHRRPRDGGRGHKPGSVTMEPSGNLDDVTFVPQNPGRRPPPPPPPYDDGNDRPGKRPPPKNGDGGRGHKPGSVTMEPSGNLDDVTFVPQNPGRRPPPPPPYDDGNDRPGKRPPPRNGGGRP